MAFMVWSCADTSAPSIYDPSFQSAPTPAITAISPTGLGLAAATPLTIAGTNFSSTIANNFVFFDGLKATLTQATTTQLSFIAPNLVKDSIKVRVSVLGATDFSNTVFYRLDASVTSFGPLGTFDQPYGIACDTAGNVFVSLTASLAGIGVKKFTPAGVKTDYSPVVGTRWSGMKIGPGGFLYTARILPVIYRIPPGGGSAVIWVGPSSGIGPVLDFDFDAQGNVWACANDVAISRVKPDLSVKTFPFIANARTARVFNGYLYVGALVDAVEAIWRFSIVSADSLGSVEKYFDMSQYGVPGTGANAITFSSDGNMYVGINGPDGIILVRSDKTWEKYYQGLFSPTVYSFAWGKGSDLYASVEKTGSTALLKINTQKTSAPYYGR